jgi:membrane protein insertase Oxa1/YidC/SpoIIIJ
MQQLGHDIHLFDRTLFGVVDLTRSALSDSGVYWPAMLLVVGSAVVQYYQTKQLLPQDKDARTLRAILRDAGSGKQADQAEVNAAIGRSTRYLLPAMIFLFTVNIASALSLYWLVGGIIAFIQQSIVLREDETEMEAMSDDATKKDVAAIPEAEVVAEKPASAKTAKKKKSKKSSANRKKRRR